VGVFIFILSFNAPWCIKKKFMGAIRKILLFIDIAAKIGYIISIRWGYFGIFRIGTALNINTIQELNYVYKKGKNKCRKII
tara:strand:- start:15 stop:257 length:243 start_codon:yes stop_codon:yes gene_type:complete